MSIEKMCIAMNPRMNPQPLFEVSLFRFYFVFTFQYLDCYCSKYLVRQTASLCLKLPLKPAFFKCFLFVIFGKLNLCLF